MEVFVRWPEIIPSDPVTTAQVGQMYAGLGVSKTTIFSRLNLDYDQEREKLLKEAQPLETASDPQITDTTNASDTDPAEERDTSDTL